MSPRLDANTEIPVFKMSKIAAVNDERTSQINSDTLTANQEPS